MKFAAALIAGRKTAWLKGTLLFPFWGVRRATKGRQQGFSVRVLRGAVYLSCESNIPLVSCGTGAFAGGQLCRNSEGWKEALPTLVVPGCDILREDEICPARCIKPHFPWRCTWQRVQEPFAFTGIR